jgi:hypothetical protein
VVATNGKLKKVCSAMTPRLPAGVCHVISDMEC